MAYELSWPELGEELARKSLTHAEMRLKHFQAGKITRRELFLITEALHEIMQGLAPWDAVDEVYALRQAVKKETL
jgi:hypothetical protein